MAMSDRPETRRATATTKEVRDEEVEFNPGHARASHVRGDKRIFRRRDFT